VPSSTQQIRQVTVLRSVPIADGQIVEQAPPEQLFSQPSDERTRRFLRRIVDAGRM
jgi:ABC-type histidine transport system ATPase subunit